MGQLSTGAVGAATRALDGGGRTCEIWAVGDAASDLARRDRLVCGLAAATRALLELRLEERAAVRGVLGHLGAAAEVERAYIFENHRDPRTGELLMSQRFEWAAGEVDSFIDDPKLQGIPYASFEGWYAAFRERRPVIEAAHTAVGLIREIMEEEEILALLLLPIHVDDELWGFVGFDSCKEERRWAEAEIEALRVFAGAIGHVIVRRRLEVEVAAASTPALQIWERTLLLPLHGALDEGKMARIEAALLAAVHSRRAGFVLLDVTGVATAGPGLSRALQRLVDAARLLGARCVLVGVSAAAARALAQADEGLRGAEVRGTLQDGLALALAELGLAADGRLSSRT